MNKLFLTTVVFILVAHSVSASIITKIEIRGNKYTKTTTILNYCGVKEGSVYAPGIEKKIESNLWNLGIFKSVIVKSKRTSDRTVTIYIYIEDMWTFFGYPLFRSEINGEGTELGVGFWDSNFLGFAHRVQGMIEYSTSLNSFSFISLSYLWRDMIRKVMDLNFLAYYSYAFRNEVLYRKISVDLKTSFSVYKDVSLDIGTHLLFPFPDDTSGRVFENYLVTGLGYSNQKTHKYLKDGISVGQEFYYLPYYNNTFHPFLWTRLYSTIYRVFGKNNLVLRGVFDFTNARFFEEYLNPAYYVRGANNYTINGDIGLQVNIEYRFLLYESPWIDFLLSDFSFLPIIFSDSAVYSGEWFQNIQAAWSIGTGLKVFAYGLSSMIRIDFGINCLNLIEGKPFSDSWQVLINLEDLF